jgi:hypothetical protein
MGQRIRLVTEHGGCCVSKTDNVHKRPKDGTHVPRTPAEIVLFQIISKSFVKEERDSNHVGGEERCHVYGHDSVEGCCAADIDESEEE